MLNNKPLMGQDADDLYAALTSNRFADAADLALRGVGSDRVREHVLAGEYQEAICILIKRYPRADHLSTIEITTPRAARAE